jgi:hypothetical protein
MSTERGFLARSRTGEEQVSGEASLEGAQQEGTTAHERALMHIGESLFASNSNDPRRLQIAAETLFELCQGMVNAAATSGENKILQSSGDILTIIQGFSNAAKRAANAKAGQKTAGHQQP